MDMNRYLIVVFCVLTGCAAAVPLANGQEFAVDQQLFAEWCAEHANNFDEAYSLPILAPVEQDQLSESCIHHTETISLLENLPKFPPLHHDDVFKEVLVSKDYKCFRISSKVYLPTILDGDFRVRAPVLS